MRLVHAQIRQTPCVILTRPNADTDWHDIEDKKMKLTILGTGNALVTRCYNTCFAFSKTIAGDESACFLVDTGGGNGILSQLEHAAIDWRTIHDIFITHKHIDHILGVLWMIRLVGQNINRGNYTGILKIYAHDEVIALIHEMSKMLLQTKVTRHFGERIIFETVYHEDVKTILGCKVTFFDIFSTKTKQFGLTLESCGQKLTCCGDEPYNPKNFQYAENATYLMHEAFCLYHDREKYKPYEKHHSTAKDAAEVAQNLGVKNLILYHTEDDNIKERKMLYTQEAKTYFRGNIFVPDDLDVIPIFDD